MKAIHGTTNQQFSKIEHAFMQNFDDGLESAGAAFTAFYRGEIVANLSGGLADREKEQPWLPETMGNFFSTTKSLTSIVLALLIDRGRANYEDLVQKHWPEFGKNGKGTITIQHVVQHQAGLPFNDVLISMDDVADPMKMSKILENMTPIWPPGQKSGYHGFTIGFLVDQIVRRIDEGHRGVEQVLREDILDRYGITDLYIGLPSVDLNNQTAKLYETSAEEERKEKMVNPEGVKLANMFKSDSFDKMFQNIPWMTIPEHNDFAKRCLPMPSNMGIGSARALAEIHSLIATGRLLSEKMLAKLANPQLVDQPDVVLGYPDCKGFGWIYTRNRLGKWNFGHTGFGGQCAFIDVDSQLAFAYLCNGLKISDAIHLLTFKRLQDALYDCIDQQ